MACSLQPAPIKVPQSIGLAIVAAAAGWAGDPARPRVMREVLIAWDVLLDEWIAAPDIPLFVRKAKDNRGSLLTHTNGRAIIPTDNSPAHWSIGLAHAGICPTLDEVREMFARDAIPVAMVISRAEKECARFRCTRGSTKNPNQLGWKVAHIDDVGLGYIGQPTEADFALLTAHHKRFLAPSNIFLVPKDYAGLAETPEFLQAFGKARDAAR